MSFEVDPKDGQACFIPVIVEDFEPTCVEDCMEFWNGMYYIGQQATKKAGYTVYPIYSFKGEFDD